LETQVISDSARAMIGKWSELIEAPHAVEASEVRRFAHAMMDTHPRYNADGWQRGDERPGPVAAPAYAMHAFRRAFDASDPLDRLASDPDFDGLDRTLRPGLPALDIALPRLLNGGYDYEFFGYFKIGDRVFCKSAYTDIQEKRSSNGVMVLVSIEDQFFNQDGQLIFKSINTIILR
jgi:hypothetical protein